METHVALLVAAALALVAAPILDPATTQDTATASQDAAARKRKRLKDNAADFWIYDDLEQSEAKAKATGKPLLVSFRCVP